VIEMTVKKDEGVPGGTPAVDFIVQGDLQVLGTDFAPVSIVPDRPAQWGALYVLPGKPLEWSSLHLVGGQLILAKGSLKLNYCRVSQGRGIAVMEGAQLRLDDCQLDENKTGLLFLHPTAQIEMNRTRLRQNEVSLFYRTNGTLQATESSVYGSGKYHAANLTTEPIAIPSLWWGSANGKTVMKRVLDGRVKEGTGLFQFSPQLTSDPMLASIKGVVPGKDPSKAGQSGPRFMAGPLFQAILPRLNVQNAGLKMTIGYGLQAGLVLPKYFEVRGTFQTVSFAATNPEAKNSLNMSFLRMGLLGRKQFPLNRTRRVLLFVEAGALMAMTQQSLTRPRDSWDLDSPMVNRSIKETNLDLVGGSGLEFQVGKHRVEVGVHYEVVPLNDDRGGSLIPLQAALNLYF